MNLMSFLYRRLSDYSTKIAAVHDKIQKINNCSPSPPREQDHVMTPQQVSPSILDRKAMDRLYETSLKSVEYEEEWEKDFRDYPDHLKFFKKLRSAQHKANETGKRGQLCWRGYRTSLAPRSGPLEKNLYISKLITALKSIRSLKAEEKSVSQT